MTCKAVLLSRPVVGSSKNNMEGFVSNSTPIEVLFLSPPDKPLMRAFPTLVFWHFVRPNSLMSFLTLSILYYSVRFFNLKSAVNLNASAMNEKELFFDLTKIK